MKHNDIKDFAENFPVSLKMFNWHQQQKISLSLSAKLNSERESYVLKTPEKNFFRRNSFTSPKEIVNNLWLKKSKSLIFSHLNINSVRYKFELLSDIIKNKIDVLWFLKQILIHPLPTGSFKFMTVLNPMDLGESEMVVEYLYLSASINYKTNWISSENRMDFHWIKPKRKEKGGLLAGLLVLNILRYDIF